MQTTVTNDFVTLGLEILRPAMQLLQNTNGIPWKRTSATTFYEDYTNLQFDVAGYNGIDYVANCYQIAPDKWLVEINESARHWKDKSKSLEKCFECSVNESGIVEPKKITKKCHLSQLLVAKKLASRAA